MRHALAPQTQLSLRYWTTGRPADMRAEGFRTILVYCVGPPDRDPAPAAGTIPWCRWMDPPIGAGTISAHISSSRGAAQVAGWIRARTGLK